MGSSGFHFRDFFTNKLSPHLRNSRLTCEGGEILRWPKERPQLSSGDHQVVDGDVFDLQGQIDTLNVAEVIDPATNTSLENTEAYVKESF